MNLKSDVVGTGAGSIGARPDCEECRRSVYSVTISDWILTGLQIVSQMGECSFT